MPIETQVTFRNCTPSPEIERDIKRRADKLARFYRRIVRCAVVVELPHRRHRGGNWFHIRITLSLPGEDVVVAHEPTRAAPARHPGVENDPRLLEGETTGRHARVVVREAFEAARRRLQHRTHPLKGDARSHEAARRRPAGPAPA